MTTYGPTSFSLIERLVAADLVVHAASAELVDTVVDERAETPREIGYFVVAVERSMMGDAAESLRLVVARNRDGSWPVPSDGSFVAFVQGAADGPANLVHNSAFRVERGAIRFDQHVGCDHRQRGDVERVSIKDIERAISDLHDRRAAAAKALVSNEPSATDDYVTTGEMEVPDAAYTTWLGGAGGGQAANPTGKRPATRRSTAK